MKIFFFLLLCCSVSQAITLGKKSDDKKSSAASKQTKPASSESVEAAKALKNLESAIACVSSKKSIKEIKACGNSVFSTSLDASDKNLLLDFLRTPMELGQPEVCPTSATEFFPERLKKGAKLFLCSEYEKMNLKKTAVFFFSQEDSEYKLMNIRL